MVATSKQRRNRKARASKAPLEPDEARKETEEPFYPGVQCLPEEDHLWKTLKQGNPGNYDDAKRNLKHELNVPSERVNFDEMMNELGIPLDIFQDYLLKAGREAIKNKDRDGDYMFINLGEIWESKDIIYRAPRTLVYVRPVLTTIDYDGTEIPVKDLKTRVIGIPVDENDSICFPLMIWIEDSWRYWRHGNGLYRLFETSSDFKEDFPALIASFHDQGYRVAYFENDSNTIASVEDITSWLSEKGIAWLHDKCDIDIPCNTHPYGQGWGYKFAFCHHCDKKARWKNGKVIKEGCRRDRHQCSEWKITLEAWYSNFELKAWDPSIESMFVKMMNGLNRFRPKGTHFCNLYTLNNAKYPKSFGDDESYTDIARDEEDKGQLADDWPQAWAYLQHELARATFTFTDEQAFEIMLEADRLQWQTRIEAYKRNQLVGISQDQVGSEQKSPVSAMTISKWVRAVKGEISRIRGERYEAFLDGAWKRTGMYASVTHDGTESKPDFVRVPFDGVSEVVSIKCFNHPRNTISIPLKDIAPELEEAKRLRAAGKACRLIVHAHNQATSYTEERLLDFASIPDPITITEK